MASHYLLIVMVFYFLKSMLNAVCPGSVLSLALFYSETWPLMEWLFWLNERIQTLQKLCITPLDQNLLWGNQLKCLSDLDKVNSVWKLFLMRAIYTSLRGNTKVFKEIHCLVLNEIQISGEYVALIYFFKTLFDQLY